MQRSLTALVFGAGGLTGSFLVKHLLDHPAFSSVKVFSRSSSGISHSKFTEIQVDFNNEAQLEKDIHGDVLFCCLGTTIRVAGSKEAFEKIDLHYTVLLARIAAKNNVKKFLMISSLGACKDSSNFYLSTKGKAEDTVGKSGVEQVYIFRPSLLLGKRKEFRFGELIGKFSMQAFSFAFIGPLRKYRAIHAEKVANAMVWFAVHGTDRKRTVESPEIAAPPVEK